MGRILLTIACVEARFNIMNMRQKKQNVTLGDKLRSAFILQDSPRSIDTNFSLLTHEMIVQRSESLVLREIYQTSRNKRSQAGSGYDKSLKPNDVKRRRLQTHSSVKPNAP